jgi:hypothetical protein
MLPYEELTRRFYEWETRGRGALQWPRCIRLEPPFRPFQGHFISSRPPVEDDGKRHGVFSWLGTQLTRPIGAPAPQPEPEVPEEAEPEPEEDDGGQEIVEFALALKEGMRVDREGAEAFLLALRACREMIALEIVATSEQIVVQWAAKRCGASARRIARVLFGGRRRGDHRLASRDLERSSRHHGDRGVRPGPRVHAAASHLPARRSRSASREFRRALGSRAR